MNKPIDSLKKNEWDALIISILKPMYKFCRKDALIAPQDLQQEAWIALLLACERYDPSKASIVTFAYHYIRGHLMRYIARRTKRSLSQLEDESKLLDICYKGDTGEDRDIMEVIMKHTSDQKHAHLLVEHFVRGKSLRQIASEQKISHGTVAIRIKKLLNLLTLRLNHENA